MKEWLKKYQVILILFIYLGASALVYFLMTDKPPMTFLMGLFFITFSFFKVIHLSKFQASFQKYDIIAQKIPYYGSLYPFIEIILGILFLTDHSIFYASILTIVILVSTNIGVILTLRKGEILECACLGVVFNLPLSNITVFENTIMILMAIIQIYVLL